LETLLNILRIAEAMACIAGFLSWKKIRSSHWKYLPFYLAFIVLSEYAGEYFVVHHLETLNKEFFGYFEIPVEFLFFFWMFYPSNKNTRFKQLPLICSVIYLVSWLIDIFLLSNHWFWFYSFSYTVGNLLLLILALRYFIQLAMSNDILHFSEDILFWVSSGLLLFYLGTFPYYGLRNTFAVYYHNLFIAYSYIMYVLNILMYLSFTIGFICGKKQNTRYS